MAEHTSSNYFAAVDIGASSGRVLAGHVADGKLSYQEVHRFDNKQMRIDGHDCWDIKTLLKEVLAGLKKFPEAIGKAPKSIGIDTWGVDFVLLDKNDKLIGDAVAYRDARTEGIPELIDTACPDLNLYEHTGIQRQAFNTIYQLVALAQEHPEQLKAACTFLTIPDYLIWALTGVKINEYTNASTTGLLDVEACDWDTEILDTLALPREIFLTPTMPGTCVGNLSASVAEELGYQAEVIAVASHDTGSAYLAVPAADDNAVYLSSGTWSLLGVENKEPITSAAAQAQNFTNEGGYERRYRFLKNIMGLWMSQSVRREFNGVNYVEGKTANQAWFDHEVGFGELISLAKDAISFDSHIDVNDECFLAPDSMIGAIKDACAKSGQRVPETPGEIMSVIYHGLSACYRDAVQGLSELTGKTYTSINIVGGGCQDALLNQMTADACGLPVYAGPVEGTCLGNLMVQMIAAGVFADLAEARACVAHSFDVQRFDPHN